MLFVIHSFYVQIDNDPEDDDENDLDAGQDDWSLMGAELERELGGS